MSPFRTAALVAALAGLPAGAELLVAPNPKPAAVAAVADVVVIGKVVELEPDTVEAPPYAGAPADQKALFKVAVVTVDENLIGGGGRTRFRVGFPADAPVAAPPAAAPPGGPRRLGRVIRPGRTAVALTVGTEGCFCLSPYRGADFFVVEGGAPLEKSRDDYAKQLDEVRKVAKAVEDPVAALKASSIAERFQAAQALLQRYQSARPGRTDREPVPAEENRLLLDLMAELPWVVTDGGDPTGPNRAALWNLLRPAELGFKAPQAVQGLDYNKMMDEATAAFLKGNRDRIKLRRYER
jgi:hypothetical protein